MWSENRELLIRGARALEDLGEQLVFVGGCTTGLLITDSAAADVRPTFDIDVVAEIASQAEYYALGKRLRVLGFREDTAIICRWQHENGISLDVMPTDPKILGFSNRWYSDTIVHAVEHTLEPGLIIRVAAPPYFCATKLVAFHGRGEGDYGESHDLEDFIAVVDGRAELAGEIRAANVDLRRYLAVEVTNLLGTREFLDVLPGYLMPDAASQGRLPLLSGRLREIASIR